MLVQIQQKCGERFNFAAVTPSVKSKCISGADHLHQPLTKYQLNVIYHGILTVK